MGDFSEIVAHDEKIGGRTRSEGHIKSFRSALEVAGLSDLGSTGNKFTWCNGHDDDTFVKEKLDHGVANHASVCKFQEVGVEVLVTWVSDHKSTLITVVWREARRYKRRNFMYEMSWGMEEECGKIIESEWG